MDFQKVSEFLDTFKDHGIPGCDCVVYYNYQPIYRHFDGYSDAARTKPVDGSELYWLYSATKVITCTALMQLAEQGKLDLEAPLANYIPEFKNMLVRDGGNLVPAKNPILIKDLFSMRAGLNYNIDAPSIQDKIKESNNQATTMEIIQALSNEPLDFEPESHYRYSLAHDVLAAVLEVVTGEKFGDDLKKNIFDPLDMKDTGFLLTSEKEARMATLYQYNGETDQSNEISFTNRYKLTENYESGGAGLICSTNDYIKFADALANWGVSADGHTILFKESIDKMRTNVLTKKQLEEFSRNWCGYGYGLGVRTMINREAAGSKSPIGEFGWDGAAGSFVLIDPENHIAVFYAQHVLNCGHVYTYHYALKNLIYEALGIE